MDKIYYRSLLFDFYSELLTEKQRDILGLYLQEDLSLGEIAEQRGISRQGVSDAIHRGIELMEQMEEKLHLTETFLRAGESIRLLESGILADETKEQLLEKVRQLKEIITVREA